MDVGDDKGNVGTTYEALKEASVPPERGTKEYKWGRTHQKGLKLSDDRASKLEAFP